MCTCVCKCVVSSIFNQIPAVQDNQWSVSLNAQLFSAGVLSLLMQQLRRYDMIPRRFNFLSHWNDAIASIKLQCFRKQLFTRPVPSHIIQPPYALSGTVPPSPTDPERKNYKEIKHMREACYLAREVLNVAREFIKAGVTTKEIDAIVHNATIERGAYPSPLNYKGYPKSVCTSVNEVVCHGIPDDTRLKDGDIINADVSVYFNGFHGDLSETFLVGNVNANGKRLVSVTKECLRAAIAVCEHDVCFSLIGKTISNLASREGFNVHPRFIGHGIGQYFHGPPDIFHFDNDFPGRMKSGMTFTIEPILSEGSTAFHILKDGWTCVSDDGSRSAQFEHTILITDTGADILTADWTSDDFAV